MQSRQPPEVVIRYDLSITIIIPSEIDIIPLIVCVD
jgi:hypothetical protein